MTRILGLVYGVAVYAFFGVTFLYAIGFTGNLVVPKSIDLGGEGGPLIEAVLVDVLFLGLFAVQHSVMARPAFKRLWTKIVPKSVERSTYVLLASAILAGLFYHWQAIPTVVWSVDSPIGRDLLQIAFWIGWALVFASTFAINHFELFGLQQVVLSLLGREPGATTFKTPSLYKLVRHPIYLGFLIAFWSAADMTVGHLLFAVATTGYILIGIALEERDLIDLFGDRYRQYRREVRMLLPWPKRRLAAGEALATTEVPPRSR